MAKDKFSEIYNLLYVGLLGCNNKIKNTLDEYYKNNTEFANPTFFFYEYLLNKPLPYNNKVYNSNEYFLLAPFIQRLANKNPYGFDPSCPFDKKIIALKEKDLALSKIIINNKHSIYSKKLIQYWFNKKVTTDNPNEGTKIFINKLEVNDAKYFFGNVEDYLKSSIGHYLKAATKITKDILSKKSMIIESGFIKSLISAFPNNNKSIPVYVLPIASNHFYYGEILFWFPSVCDLKNDNISICDLKKENNKVCDFNIEDYKVNSKLKYLLKILFDIINEYYIPALCIIHEHFYEKKIIKINNKNSIPFLQNTTSHSIYMRSCFIEDKIVELWKKRKTGLINYTSSLVFKNYLIASPEMIRLVGDIINKATKLKKSQDTLPSALIVGGAGSGKNNIIEFLKIFSNSYFNGTTHYINMAGIKPDADVSSILMGTTDITKKYPGMFSAIRKETMGKIKKLKKGKEVDGINIYPTLILDEFNSLNIESQGILLRFIENSEIIKMGAIRDDLVNNQIICNNFLIIGIMNEDPDDLSREKAIEFITKNEYISGLVGDLFYEQIMKIRRLRPDIKYRMIKSGKFEIPNLKNRKFDIPILFYLFINGEIKQKGREVFISLNALDKLISPYIEWPGNIRQLQALAKIVCEFIPQSELNPQNRDCIIIKENYIDSAIKVMGLN